jgi:hypothetical protein
MQTEIRLEFPEFITHIPKNNPKDSSKTTWQKIGFNSIYASPHYTLRNALVGAIHKYLDKHIPQNLIIQGPVETQLIIYVPINYGDVKLLKDKQTQKRFLSWKKPYKNYKPKWDIGNLANMWLKCLDDMIIKKGILPDDTIEHVVKTSYEYVPCDTIKDRKLVYIIKTRK